ncbi:cupin domain-containing protein [Kaistia geumhonensis]|uniref:Quercetin dioxygenase-like cupin family protein n=1 Tax=Kaistia geumhonensis TaxID=410839 RepID=A0ABU0MD38_9HYPH|nr:cupin domain-containing protein [Kaistia geumhonensis]MCX5481623.1 cupin domain-containing protein [Kaistia geumhonensis]MDQ0518698.1 quercetin dioxygenase-like cupin family protein [Kaistia geumhonensis]
MKSVATAAAAVLGALLLSGLGLPRPVSAEEAYKPSVSVTPILKTTRTTSGDPIRYPDIDDPEVQSLIVEIPPGGETGWHYHPVPAYAYILAGAIEVESETGEKRVFKAGESFAEMVNRKHDGRVVGDEPVRILMIVTGEAGKPFSVKTEAPH